jgi:hypothetical protein
MRFLLGLLVAGFVPFAGYHPAFYVYSVACYATFFHFYLHISKKISNFAAESCKDMDEEQFIAVINKSMQESAEYLRAMGRTPYSVTREQAERQVAMLLKAKEEFFAKQNDNIK